jgi:hypothetical protein
MPCIRRLFLCLLFASLSNKLRNETVVVLAFQNKMFLSVQQASYETKQRNADKIYVHIVYHTVDSTPIGLFGTKSGKFT